MRVGCAKCERMRDEMRMEVVVVVVVVGVVVVVSSSSIGREGVGASMRERWMREMEQ